MFEDGKEERNQKNRFTPLHCGIHFLLRSCLHSEKKYTGFGDTLHLNNILSLFFCFWFVFLLLLLGRERVRGEGGRAVHSSFQMSFSFLFLFSSFTYNHTACT